MPECTRTIDNVHLLRYSRTVPSLNSTNFRKQMFPLLDRAAAGAVIEILHNGVVIHVTSQRGSTKLCLELLTVEAKRQIEKNDLFLPPMALLELQYLFDRKRIGVEPIQISTCLQATFGVNLCAYPGYRAGGSS